jgi:ABC-2 type transport system ATP-binding protein
MSIVVHGVRKTFGTVRAVDDVDFEISSGQIVGLIGPNGSGKTTILRMLATFLAPDAGSIVVAGLDAAIDPVAIREQIGYLPETLPGYPDARVIEYLNFRARLKGIARRHRPAEIDRCLTACQMAVSRSRILGRLSQGQRRRVGIADALLGSPAVLLLDEPTIGLDPLQVRQIRDLLRELSGRTTVLVSTHLLAEAEATCDRVLMLVRGRLVSDVPIGKAANESIGIIVTLRADGDAARKRLGAMRHVDSIREVTRDGELVTLHIGGSSPSLAEETARVCVEEGWGVRELRDSHNDLESHFVRVALSANREAA